MDKRFLVVLSGGMDSTTLLWNLHDNKQAAMAVSFDYGQRHRRELRAAEATCAKLGIPRIVIQIPDFGLYMPGSALTDHGPAGVDVPHGHYADATMVKTVVPNRNMMMISIAAGIALAHKLDGVAVGVHSGDHAIYPDCRENFILAVRRAIRFGNYDADLFDVYAPYLHIDKGAIAAIGKHLGVDYSLTWTCYEGGEHPCGKCGACVERAEAFAHAGMDDPLLKVQA